MKHLEHKLKTYVYSYYNMCNISIYFCNIYYNTYNKPWKHLKHLNHTIATCAFSVAFVCCLTGLSTQISKPQSVKEVAGVELVGDTDLGRGRRMEHGHDGRHESRSKHLACRACRARRGRGRVRPASRRRGQGQHGRVQGPSEPMDAL
jgi:hypothetical protein